MKTPIRFRDIALLAALLLTFGAAPAAANKLVDSAEPVVVSDDVYKRMTDVESASDAATAAKGNHGHGNNADGVDSSNPGQGKGGPNGADDPSCGSGGCVDDEAGGGGSSVAKSKGKGKK